MTLILKHATLRIWKYLPLRDICARIGLSVEEHIFPYLLLEEEEDDDDDDDETETTDEGEHDNQDHERRRHRRQQQQQQQQLASSSSATTTASSSSSSLLWLERKKRVPTKADYVAAAYECLMVEEETDEMMHVNDDEFEELMEGVVQDVVRNNPALIQEVEYELMRENPVVWDAIQQHLQDGQSLQDRPDILQQILHLITDTHTIITNHDDYDEFEDEEDDGEEEDEEDDEF